MRMNPARWWKAALIGTTLMVAGVLLPLGAIEAGFRVYNVVHPSNARGFSGRPFACACVAPGRQFDEIGARPLRNPPPLSGDMGACSLPALVVIVRRNAPPDTTAIQGRLEVRLRHHLSRFAHERHRWLCPRQPGADGHRRLARSAEQS